MKTIRINVEFPLDIPMAFDENGRPVHPFRLVAPYIDEFAQQVQYVRSRIKNEDETVVIAGKTGEVERKGGLLMEKMATFTLHEARERLARSTPKQAADILWNIFDPAREPALQERLYRREQESIERHKAWMADKERECQELYGMSWDEFSKMTWDQQKQVRSDHNVEWDGFRWARKTK